jgi:hypothetical protein
MTNTDMTVGVDYLLMSEDAVGDNEIVQQSVQMGHHSSPASVASMDSAIG